MVRGLSGFIGDGAGGLLPNMGWTLKEFEAFINKAETDTAFEAFAKRKRAMQDGLGSSGVLEDKSPSDDLNAPRKRPRTVSTNGAFDATTDVNFTSGVGSAFGSYDSDAAPMGLYSSMRPPAGFSPAFLGLGSDQQGSSSFMSSGLASSTGLGFRSPSGGTNGRDAFTPSYPSGTNAAPQATASSSSMPNIPFMQTSNGSTATPAQSSPATNNIESNSLEDPKAQEARKLVGCVDISL